MVDGSIEIKNPEVKQVWTYALCINYYNLLTNNLLFISFMNFDADFGFAQYLNSEEQTQTMRGSPLYMVMIKINN